MSQYDYSLKVLLLADPSTGKEELFRKYFSGYFQEDLKLTIGIDFYSKTTTFQDKKVKIQLWDFGGEERFRFLLSQYCKGSIGAIIMYDITNSNTLKHLSEWFQLIRENAGDIPIVLVGNIFNLEKSREVSEEEGVKLAEKYNLFGFFEISTKTGENVEETFESLTEILINKLPIPL